MSIMSAFAKGYLGGEIDKNTARRERQEKIDDRAAQLADDIERTRKTAEINAEFDELKLDKEAKRRKMDLIGLGFKSEYIDQHAGYALSSDTNFKNYLDMGTETYGVTNWWKTPTNHGGNIGQTIQEIAMNSSENTQNFNTQSAVNTVKNENNISDNVAGSQFDITPTTGGSVSKDKVQYIGSELFYGKKKQKIGEGKRFISSTGEVVDAFQISQTPGEEDFGPIYYVPTIDGNVPVSRYFNNVSYFPTDSDKGKSFIEQYNPTLSEQKDLKFLVDMGEGNLQYVSGRRDVLTDGSVNDFITYIPKNIVTKTNLMLNQYIPSQAEGVPGEGNMTDPEFKHYEMPVKDFKIFMEDKGISIASFGDNKDSRALAGEQLGETVREIIDPNDRSKTFKNDFLTSTGLVTSEMLIQDMFGNTTIKLTGNDAQDQLIGKFSNIHNRLMDSWETSSISKDTIKGLDINPDASYSSISAAAGSKLSSVTNKSILFENNIIKNMDDEQLKSYIKLHLGENSRLLLKSLGDREELAKDISYEKLSKVNTIENIIFYDEYIDSELELARVAETDAETAAANTLLSTIVGGQETIDSVIEDFITDPNNSNQLLAAKQEISNLLGDRATADTIEIIFNTFVDPKLDLIGGVEPEPIGDTRSKKEKEEFERTKNINLWLEEKSPVLDDNIEVENTLGGKASLIDSDTGYQIFKSPSLEPGEVLPRPNVNPLTFSALTQENWDILYSETHNPDGSAK